MLDDAEFETVNEADLLVEATEAAGGVDGLIGVCIAVQLVIGAAEHSQNCVISLLTRNIVTVLVGGGIALTLRFPVCSESVSVPRRRLFVRSPGSYPIGRFPGYTRLCAYRQ